MGAVRESSSADWRLLEEGGVSSSAYGTLPKQPESASLPASSVHIYAHPPTASSSYGTLPEQPESASLPASSVHIYAHPPTGYRLHSISALWDAGYKPPSEVAALPSEPLRAFYETQNSLLDRYASAAREHPAPCVTAADWRFLQARERHTDDVPARTDKERRVKNAIIASNICNAVLLLAQFYAFATSGSLSLLAVFLDAFLDMVSGFVVLFTWYMKTKRDKHRYPVGRSRMEPLGVIGMACLMTAATLLTLEQSIGSLWNGESNFGFSGLTVVSGSILLSALAVKLVLYNYCVRIEDASVQALAEDHFNDCLSNSVSFCTVLLAQHFIWWVDPLGGIFISCLIIRNWISHTLEHFDQLLGKAAGPDMLNVLTFMACNHHPDVRLVDTVRGYHVGHGLYVEVDIVLPADMQLHRAHDIGESLQTRIEKLEDVERCFVHIDTETIHSPDSEHKTV